MRVVKVSSQSKGWRRSRQNFPDKSPRCKRPCLSMSFSFQIRLFWNTYMQICGGDLSILVLCWLEVSLCHSAPPKVWDNKSQRVYPLSKKVYVISSNTENNLDFECIRGLWKGQCRKRCMPVYTYAYIRHYEKPPLIRLSSGNWTFILMWGHMCALYIMQESSFWTLMCCRGFIYLFNHTNK